MSRLTDRERGARIAHGQAKWILMQPDLFPGDTRLEQEHALWRSICAASEAELADSKALREALHGGR